MNPKIDVLFVAGFGPIVQDGQASRKLYLETLGLPLKGGDYLRTDALSGVKEFALWPLSQAAQSCFGAECWPEDLPVPQAWLEFDVVDIGAASEELQALGYTLLISARMEPWGQTVTRFLSPEGILVGLSHTPWLRGEEARSS